MKGKGTCVLTVSLLLSLLSWPAQSASANDTAFSGEATVVQATVLGLSPIVLSDTGALDSTGGAKEASLLNASVPGLLTAEVLHASTVGQGQRSSSEASVLDVTLTVGGNTISAGLLRARATAECHNGTASVSGSSEIVDLVVNGQAVVVSGQPNQTISLPVGRVIINEQQSSVSGNTGDITVNALHVVVPEIADVVISSAHADITCGGKSVCSAGTDFVTGGGWITTPSDAKGTFGVAGGMKNGALWGHLTYIDHGTGLKVKGTGVTAYTVLTETMRAIDGTAEIDGQAGTYRVWVDDKGEPGRNDTFKITLSNGYSAGTVYLQGGNIQLHQPTCP